ncbi:MAG: helix-turn-helix domain-containing protein [Azospirillaceae bacterium]|nr:helix-turn-helix domain-containing protein [Azospirillaceae bacterium]
MARMTMDQIKAARPKIDRARIDATADDDIGRQMIEDGEDPLADLSAFTEDLQPARIRAQHGMSQTQFAAALTIPVATVRNWEKGRVSPDPAARALLRIASREPEIALAALMANKKAS